MSRDVELRWFVWAGINDTVFMNNSRLVCSRLWPLIFFTMQSNSFSRSTFCLHKLKHCSIKILFWCYNVASHIKIWGCIIILFFFRQPRPQLLTSRGSSQLSNHWLSWLRADMRYNLKSFLELCLLAGFTVSRAARREESSYAKSRIRFIKKRKKNCQCKAFLSVCIPFYLFTRVGYDWKHKAFANFSLI